MLFRSRRSFLQSGLFAGGLLLLSGLTTAGCGGGTEGLGGLPDTGTPRSIQPSITINWAARSRAIDGPSSALSAAVTITGTNGSSVSFNADRPDNNVNAVTQTYNAPRSIEVAGNPTLTVVFHAARGGAGSVIGSASARVTIQDDGVIPTAVTNIQSAIARVEVPLGQSVNVGEQKFLAYSAISSNGNIVAVAAGSAFFTVVAGSDTLTVSGEVGQGIAGGVASVIATVDGKASAPANVSVIAAVKIALVANSQDTHTIAFVQSLHGRGIAPTSYDFVPDPSTVQNYDVLMILANGTIKPTIGPGDASRVKAFLDANKAVVLLGSAPAILATGTYIRGHSSNDTSSIASWFAGISRFGGFNSSGSLNVRVSPGKYPLPDSIAPGSAVHDGGIDSPVVSDVDQINPTADKVIRLGASDNADVFALAYEPLSGGRLYWQAHPYGSNPSYTEKMLSMLIAGTNWTAKR